MTPFALDLCLIFTVWHSLDGLAWNRYICVYLCLCGYGAWHFIGILDQSSKGEPEGRGEKTEDH